MGGVGSALQALAVIAVVAIIFTFLLNLVALGIGHFRPNSLVPLYLALVTGIALVPLFLLLLGGLCWMLPLVLSAALTALNLILWRKRYRRFVPHPEANVDSWRVLGGPGAALAIMAATFFVSCAGMWPLQACMTYLEYGRWPADIRASDIKQGMTADEVRSRYGRPHEGDGTEEWYYVRPSPAGQDLRIYFDNAGRVRSTWIVD